MEDKLNISSQGVESLDDIIAKFEKIGKEEGLIYINELNDFFNYL